MLTVEIEHIDADALDSVAAELGLAVEPTPSTLRLIQVHNNKAQSPQQPTRPGSHLLDTPDPESS